MVEQFPSKALRADIFALHQRVVSEIGINAFANVIFVGDLAFIAPGYPTITVIDPKPFDPVESLQGLTTASFYAIGAVAIAKLAIGETKDITLFLGSIAFIEFIHEESMQTTIFPIQLMIKEGLLDEAEEQIRLADGLVVMAENFLNSVGILNPLSLDAFKANAKAVRNSLKAYKLIIQKKRTRAEDSTNVYVLKG